MNLKKILDSLTYNPETKTFQYISDLNKEGLVLKGNDYYKVALEGQKAYALMLINAKTKVLGLPEHAVKASDVRILLKNTEIWDSHLKGVNALKRDLGKMFSLAVRNYIESLEYSTYHIKEIEILVPKSSSRLVTIIANSFDYVEFTDSQGVFRHIKVVGVREAFHKRKSMYASSFVDKEVFKKTFKRGATPEKIESEYQKLLSVIQKDLDKQGYLDSKSTSLAHVAMYEKSIINMFDKPVGMVPPLALVVILDDFTTSGKTIRQLNWEEALTMYVALFKSDNTVERGKSVLELPYLRIKNSKELVQDTLLK